MPDSQKPDRRLQSIERHQVEAAASRETSRPADSVPIVAAQMAKLPATFGRYQVEKLLGRGAMGAVYLARDTQLDRAVALKIPKVAASGSKRLLLRLQTEAKAAARLDHPSLCKVFDAGEVNGQCFIAMQYIEGDTLKTQLESKGKSITESVALVLQLAEGLAEAHALQIIHRDLKPENIMMNRRGTPVIMDFGLAKFSSVTSSPSATQAGTILGSPAYMSPEQASGQVQDIDQRSDIYSLGIILFELLTGKWPFDGSAMQILGQKSLLEPPSPLDLKPALPPSLAAICHKMIAKSSTDRYQSINDVVADLKQLDLNQFAAQSSEIPSDDPPRSASRSNDGSISLHAEKQLESIRNRKATPSTPEPAEPAPDSTPLDVVTNSWWKMPAVKWSALGAAALLLMCVVIIVIKGKEGTRTTIELEDAEEIVIKSEKPKAKKRVLNGALTETAKQTTNPKAQPAPMQVSASDELKSSKTDTPVAPVAKVAASPADSSNGVLPVGTVFKGKWQAYDGGSQTKESQQTITVSQRDGNKFVLLWELHDIFRKWKFAGTLSDDESAGKFTGEFTELLRSLDEVNPIIGNNNVEGKISLDGKEITGRFFWHGTNTTAKWTATRVDPIPASDEVPVQVGVKNGNFEQGLDDWQAEGGAAAFRVFNYAGEKAMTTHGSSGERDTGRLFQTFKVPDNATTLSWEVHGGRPAGVYVSLIRDDKVYKRTSGLNNNIATRVIWDVKPVRGEIVTLEIVDYETAHWGFIGAGKFKLDTAD